jgi:hypothetical protein
MERYRAMIKERHQGEVRIDSKCSTDVEGTCMPREHRLFHMQSRIPIRHGVSQRVIEAAKRLKKEYQADLDYLQDK